MRNSQTNCYENKISEKWTTTKKQVINPPYQALQGQSIARPIIVLLNILVQNSNLTCRGPVVIYSILYF